MEQVTKKEMDKIVNLFPKIEENKEIFKVEELVIIKAFFEKITGVKVGNMLNCGGRICSDVRKSIVNYMAQYKHIKNAEPKKEAPTKEETLEANSEEGFQVGDEVEGEDGEYPQEDGSVLIVEDGKITKIEETQAEEDPKAKRNRLMTQAIELAEKKGIRKPTHNAGIKKLESYIEKNN